jgi:peptidoglycan-associated lipoprotein
LGARRARAAKDYLVTLGIAANRLTTISYGEELPLCHEHTEECWAQNRRDHFVVASE